MYDYMFFPNPFTEATTVLYQARDAFFKAFNTELEEIELNYTQAFVLVSLRMSNRPLTVSEIAHSLFRKVHSTSELVARMEKCGYLEKAQSVEDKRYVNLRLTSKGIERADEVARRIFLLCERLFCSFTPEEIEQCNKYLKKIRDQAIQEVGNEIIGKPPDISMDGLNELIFQVQREQSNLLSRVQA